MQLEEKKNGLQRSILDDIKTKPNNGKQQMAHTLLKGLRDVLVGRRTVDGYRGMGIGKREWHQITGSYL
jgi:hypothetical protein